MQWSEGRSSRLRFALADPSRALLVTALVTPAVPEQSIQVNLNGADIETVPLRKGRAWFQTVLPAGRLKSGTNLLEFRYGTTVKPIFRGVGSTDVRRLGVSWERIQAAPLPKGETLQIGAPRTRAFLVEGWGNDEKWRDWSVVWSVGASSSADVFIDPLTNDYEFEVIARTELGPVSVPVFLGGRLLGTVTIDETMRAHSLKVPRDRLHVGRNKVLFRHARPFQPAALNPESQDDRLLGIMVHRIGLVPLSAAVRADIGTDEARVLQSTGWAGEEIVDGRTVAWSLGQSSELEFPLNPLGTDYEISLTVRPIVRDGVVSVRVLLNGVEKSELEFTDETWQTRVVKLGRGALKEGKNKLEFRYSQTVRPVDEDPSSSDNRELAMLFDRVDVQPAAKR
jgi:hypothetical protein